MRIRLIENYGYMLAGSTPMVNDKLGDILIANGKAIKLDLQSHNSSDLSGQNDKALDKAPKDKMIRKGRHKTKV